jgi:cytochrome c oxidase cbb3-type subunit IV
MAELYATLKSLWVVWLMGVFLAIAIWAYWPRNKQRFEAHARIPLDDDAPSPGVGLKASLRLDDAPSSPLMP